MQVTVHNLGVVSDATLDIKPLTVFVGPNNEGKTWVAYLLAALFGSYGFAQSIETIDKHLAAFPPLDNAIRELLETGSSKLDYIQFAEQYLEPYFNHIAAHAPDWLRSYLNARGISFEKLDVRVVLLEMDKRRSLAFIRALPFDQTWPERRKATPGSKQPSTVRTFKESGEPTIHFFAEGNALEELPSVLIKSRITNDVLQWMHRSVYPNTHVFPVERTTYMTVIPPAVYGADSQERPARSRKSAPAPAQLTIEPVHEFMRLVASAVQTDLEDRIASDGLPELRDLVTHYLDLAAVLERDILGGSVDDTRGEDALPREILFHPTDGVALSLPLVSSMVKELSPLVLYLRYLAMVGDFIVIDEPEMNLHPEGQARLTEFLAMLVNARIRVLITTHSSYIVDHLVNLMAAAESSNPQNIVNEFYLHDARAFIDKESVSVYLFDKGTATNILDENGMINWMTFSRVSERLADIFARVQEG